MYGFSRCGIKQDEPKMEVNKVLAIGAHPDDVELGCGGALALFRQAGTQVVIASMARGDKGSRELSTEETVRVRREESERAAQVIRAAFTSLGLSDSEIFEDLENRTRVIELLRETQPEVVITHSPTDYHADHRITAHLVGDAAYLSTSFKFKTKHPPLSRFPIVYHMDNYLGVGFEPEEYVDISQVIDTKKEMILQHKSQLAHLQQRAGEDVLDDMLVLARLRGKQSGVDYAEGFRLHRTWPHIRTQRVLP